MCTPTTRTQRTGVNEEVTVEVLGMGQTQIYPRAPSKTLRRLQEMLGSEAIGQVHRHAGGQREPRPNTGNPSHPPDQATAHSSCPLPDTHIHTDSHTHSHTHRNSLTPRRDQADQADTQIRPQLLKQSQEKENKAPPLDCQQTHWLWASG